jgi:hypothetical protein
MDLKKRFDYNDINNFLPDNQTLGNSQYFYEKFGGRLPNGMETVLEAKTRVEFSEEDVKVVVENYQNKQKQEYEQLMKEYEERVNEKPSEPYVIPENITRLNDAK